MDPNFLGFLGTWYPLISPCLLPKDNRGHQVLALNTWYQRETLLYKVFQFLRVQDFWVGSPYTPPTLHGERLVNCHFDFFTLI